MSWLIMDILTISYAAESFEKKKTKKNTQTKMKI